MTPYFCNIKIAPNPTAGDSLSIGLLAFSDERFWLEFSEQKMRIVKRLLQNDDIVDFAKREIEQKIAALNKRIDVEKGRLFEFASELDSGYMSYVSKYSNNLVQFGSPIMLDDKLDAVKFSKLFALMIEKPAVHESAEDKYNTKLFNERIQSLLIKPVAKTANTKIQLRDHLKLVFNYELDCVAKNGSVIVAQSIPFFQSPSTVSKHIQMTEIVFNRLERDYASGGNIKQFVIADEPNTENHELMKLWEGLKPLGCDVVKSLDADRIASLIKDTNATKLFE